MRTIQQALKDMKHDKAWEVSVRYPSIEEVENWLSELRGYEIGLKAMRGSVDSLRKQLEKIEEGDDGQEI